MHCELLGTINVREYDGRAPQSTGVQAQRACASAGVEEQRGKPKRAQGLIYI